MTIKELIQVLNPPHYSTSNSAWNNVVCGPGKRLLNDSEKVASPDERQLKHTSVNLGNSIPQVNLVNIKKEEAFKLIIAARELVKNWEVPTPATMQQYSAAMLRLRKNKRMPEDYAQTKRGYYFYRAALVAHALSVMQNRLFTINRLQKKNDPEWIAASCTLLKQLKILKRYPPDQEKTHLEAEVKGRWDASGKTPRSNAKRRGIGMLPANWRTVFWKSFPEKSPHRLSLAILSITGCRPSELTKGVQIKIDALGNLHITIQGSKIHGGKYGQKVRQLSIHAKTDEAIFLRGLVMGQAGGLTVSIKNPKALTESVRRHSKRLWPKRKYVVSPYSFRHQLAADLKNDLLPEEVAMTMGHSVCKTQQYYGMRNQGRGGTQIFKVTAEKDLRRNDAPQPNKVQSDKTGPKP